jgi:hypothetical protein
MNNEQADGNPPAQKIASAGNFNFYGSNQVLFRER